MFNSTDEGVEIFSTCPPSSTADKATYLREVADVARWSEKAGCTGILVYSDNSQVDPWLLAQVIIVNTRKLCPLIAVQPVYMHPFSVAKMIASLGFLHGRRVYLNMVAGGFKNDLIALNDQTPHDDRYQRLVEYTTVIKLLLSSTTPVSFEGKYYQVDKLSLPLKLPENLFPGLFISGSSDAGLAAAREIGATAIQYPKPVTEYTDDAAEPDLETGIRIGILCRENARDAWKEAHKRFPEERAGQLTHQMAMKVSDSVWHKQLSSLDEEGRENPYWLVPFKNYKTMCPYLVGDYQQVGLELGKYMTLGYQTFILDVPGEASDLDHTRRAFDQAAVAVV